MLKNESVLSNIGFDTAEIGLPPRSGHIGFKRKETGTQSSSQPKAQLRGFSQGASAHAREMRGGAFLVANLAAAPFAGEPFPLTVHLSGAGTQAPLQPFMS